MNRLLSTLAVAALSIQVAAMPAQARMSDDEKAAAAIAILGIAALAHHKHHYEGDYAPDTGEATAEFERGYRDGVHGYPYNNNGSTRNYAEGYQAGDKERTHSVAHREIEQGNRAPHMATKECVKIVARNFDVDQHNVHIKKSRSPAKHEWQIETAVGHQHMVCTMRDTGEVIEVRGGRL
jgi:hypothetical protein